MKNNMPFSVWARWFEDFKSRQIPLPRPQEAELSADERRFVGPSLRQFQLGESSEARNLLAKAGRYAARTGDISYPLALTQFIREENRHAAMLGRFMDQEGIPRARKHWLDGIFRAIRHRVNLRRSLTILVSAEFLAVPYYTALGRATSSTLLAGICKQVLLDEARHIEFQSLALKQLSQGRGRVQRKSDDIFARICLEIALDMVWFSHGRVLQAGGYDYHAFRQASLAQLRLSRQMVHGDLPIPEPNAAPSRALMPFGVRIFHQSPTTDPEQNPIGSLSKRAIGRSMFQTP